MYRVLVADDEEVITDGLVSTLEETQRFELDVYKAYSGSEALRLLNEIQFDIVISDICMPGMTGIELAKIIREKWPLCHVIFQTGYDDFQYAQQAIRQRVTHYVLKSEGEDALLDAVGECARAIDRDMDMKDTLVRAKEETRLYKAMLRRNMVWTLLFDKNKLNFKDRVFDKVEISLKQNAPIMLLAGRSTQELTDEMALAIDMAMRKKINYAVSSETIWMDHHVILWAMQPVAEENLQHAQAVIKGMAEGLKYTIQQTLEISVSFVFQEKQIGWDSAREPFEELRRIAAYRLKPNSEIAIAGSEYFKEKGSSSDEQNEAELERSFVSRLTTYLWEHIDGDLSLCTLSDKLHLNPTYLSRRFKELTGKTLTETILKIRMERACELLKTTSYRISEIAPMVGYETAANFSKVFKKYMKVTPREYRDGEGILQ